MTESPPAPATPSHPSWAEHASNFYKAGDIGRAIEVVEARVKTHPPKLESMLPLMQQVLECILKFERGNFLLAYQGEDDRQLQRCHVSLLGEIAL